MSPYPIALSVICGVQPTQAALIFALQAWTPTRTSSPTSSSLLRPIEPAIPSTQATLHANLPPRPPPHLGLARLINYILRLGRQILEDNAYSSDGRPDLSWLPRSPSAMSPSLLSLGPTRSANRSANVTTRARPTPPSQPTFRPDPDGITAPIFFAMGGPIRAGDVSSLTSGDFHPIQGGSPRRDYILTHPSSLSSTGLPFGGASVMSSIAGSLAPTAPASSSDTPSPDLAAPQPLVPHLSIQLMWLSG